MSLDVPTTETLSDNIIAQLESELSQTIPVLPKAFSRVLAKALSGTIVLVYKYASFQFLQLFVAHATMEETTIGGKKVRPLLSWGRLFGVPDPAPAVRAELLVAVTVTNQTGTLRAGRQLLRSETGVVYTTVADAALDAAEIQVTVRASVDHAGAIGNLETNDVISFANPLPNVARDAAVVSSVKTGADAESTEAYRTRVIRRVQRRPQGGAYADYQGWAEEVEGIINAYPYTGSPGGIVIYCEADEVSSGSSDGIPTGGQLGDVFANIELEESGLATRRPANAAITVDPIARTAFDLEVQGLSPDTPENRAEIEAGVDEFLRSREPYIVGLSVLPRLDRISEAEVGGIVSGIAHAQGATVAEVSLSPGPASTLGQGEKAKLGTTTWSS